MNSPAAPQQGSSLGGLKLILVLGVFVVFVGAIYSDTVISMVHTWSVNDTFAHGFMILPISMWLVWHQRDNLAGAVATPQLWPLFVTLVAGLAWFVAAAVDVRVVQQFAFVLVLVSGVCSILGGQLAMRVCFPLGFLFLAVPIGAGLIPPLIELTTDTTEALVRGSGVPVYREGNYLMLPSGNWSVVEACSGIRYLIASFTLGLVYAYLTYTSNLRRIVFVAASIAVPIVANSLRAYGIVMIGHLSDMKLATGVDHLIYGWVFFGAVMLLLFWVGSFWQQPELSKRASSVARAPLRSKASPWIILSALVVAALGPASNFALQSTHEEASYSALPALSPALGWSQTDAPDREWLPNLSGADRELSAYFSDETGIWTGVLLRQYLQQDQGGELVQSERPWRADADHWRALAEQQFALSHGTLGSVVEGTLAYRNERLLVWAWYRVGGRYLTNPYQVKLWEAWSKITVGDAIGSRLFVVTPMDDSRAAARTRLTAFVSEHLNQVEVTLDSRSEPTDSPGVIDREH